MKKNVRALVIKSDGKIILRENEVKLVTDTPYLSPTDDCLDNLIDSRMIDSNFSDNDDTESKAILESLKKAFHANGANSIGFSGEKLKDMVETLRGANSIADLKRVYDELMRSIIMDSREVIAELYDIYPELVLSVMTKAIIECYVRSQLIKVSGDSIIDLEVRKAKDEPLINIMKEILDIDFSEPATNGVDLFLAKTVCDQLDVSYMKLSSRCFDCSNGYVDSCPKIADYPFTSKKDIGSYPFITDGFQEYVDGELDKFIIFGCKNYMHAFEKLIPSREEEKKIYQTLRNMLLLYYGVDDIEEANSIISNNERFGYK